MASTNKFYNEAMRIIGSAGSMYSEIAIEKLHEKFPTLARTTISRMLYNMERLSFPLLTSRRSARNGVAGERLMKVYSVAPGAEFLEEDDGDKPLRHVSQPVKFNATASGYEYGRVPTMAQLADMLVAAVNQPYGGEV